MTYVNVSLFSGKDDRTNGVSIYSFFFTNLDVSLKKNLSSTILNTSLHFIGRSLFENTALWEVLSLKRRKK